MEQFTKMQQVNKFFYETAVSRVQTRIKSDKQERQLREAEESGGVLVLGADPEPSEDSSDLFPQPWSLV